jgi:uncharacterized metal-binding protein
MPGHKAHDTIGLVAALPIAAASFATLHYGLGDTITDAAIGAGIVAGSHLVATFWLSPDLDLDSAIDNRWGPLRPIWLPYMHLVPHRSWVSHSVVGGVLRLAYLASIIWLILFIASVVLQAGGIAEDIAYHTVFLDWLLSLQHTGTRPALLIVAGVIAADLVHVGADLITSEIKATWRSLWR